MTLPVVNLTSILPAIILALFGIAIMVIDPFVGRGAKLKLGWLGFTGTLAAMLALRPMSGQPGAWYADIWLVDDYTIFFHVVFLLIAALTILTSIEFLDREHVPTSEFFSLVLFATSGMLLMSGAGELMMIFIGLEILSIATYILAGYRRGDLKSNEASLKYFLLGSFASAFFLYGVALIFGATGSTNLGEIAAAIRDGIPQIGLVYVSSAMILIALGFKVALAPFHVWTPDVYEGAPTPVTAFMSVGPKAAGFAILLRIFLTAFSDIQDRWILVIWVGAALTMVIGNVVAVAQTNIKRMLAYSSIAHAGYVAVAFTAGTELGVAAAMFYLLAYSVMTLGAFAIVTILSRKEDRLVELSDYAGLAARRPSLAALMSLFLLSLAGIPGTAGFAGKFFIFRAAVDSGLIWLSIIGLVTTVVSFYYYLQVIVQMYMREPNEEFSDLAVAPGLSAALIVTAILTLYLGILPASVLDWATEAALGVIIR